MKDRFWVRSFNIGRLSVSLVRNDGLESRWAVMFDRVDEFDLNWFLTLRMGTLNLNVDWLLP